MKTLIPVVGSEEFKSRLNMALEWLGYKSKVDIVWAQRFISRIEQSTVNGMDMFAAVPTLRMTSNYAGQSSTPWLASVIAHEACHAYLYRYHQSLWPGQHVPVDYFSGTEAEKKCIEYQFRVLTRVEGSSKEFRHLSEQDGTHWKNPPR